jgi:hypothetical protein
VYGLTAAEYHAVCVQCEKSVPPIASLSTPVLIVLYHAISSELQDRAVSGRN